MPNNPDPVPTSINLSPQQLIVATTNIPPTTNAPAFVDWVGEFFRILELEFPVKSSEKNLQLATFSRQKDETLKMFYRRLLKLKENTQSITNLEAAHRYLRSWKVLQHSTCRFCNESLQNLETRTLCWICTTFLKNWNWLMHTMRPILWSLHRVQGLNLRQLRQLDHHILLQGLKRCTRLHPSYLLATIVPILPTKLMSATFLPRISFVIIVGKRDIKNLSLLPSSYSRSNSDYNGKICQQIPLSLNQKPRHLNLPLRLCSPRVIPTRMLRRRSTMLTRGRCFKPMQFKFRLYKMNSNH